MRPVSRAYHSSRLGAQYPPDTAPVVSDSGSVEPRNTRRARGVPRGRSVFAADSGAQEPLGRKGAGEREGRWGAARGPGSPATNCFPFPRARAPLPSTDRNSLGQGGGWGERSLRARYWLRLPRLWSGKRLWALRRSSLGAGAPCEEDRGVTVGTRSAGPRCRSDPPPSRARALPLPFTRSPGFGEGAGGRHTGPTPLQRSPGTRAGGDGTRRGRGAGAAMEQQRRRRRQH